MKVLLIFGCFLAFAQQVAPQTTYNEKSLVDSEVTLPCAYDQTTDGSLLSVIWTVLTGGSPVTLYMKSMGTTGNQATPPAQYAGRVELVGDVNLKLIGVRIEDEQQYRCFVTAILDSQTSIVNLEVFVQPPARPKIQVQYDPQPSDNSSVPVNTNVTFTCTSTGGKPPANLTWSVGVGNGTVSVNPTYTSSTNSQGVGDATSTFYLIPEKFNATYRAQCTASGPDLIETHHASPVTFTTEPEPKASAAAPRVPKGGTGLGGIVIGVMSAMFLVPTTC